MFVTPLNTMQVKVQYISNIVYKSIPIHLEFAMWAIFAVIIGANSKPMITLAPGTTNPGCLYKGIWFARGAIIDSGNDGHYRCWWTYCEGNGMTTHAIDTHCDIKKTPGYCFYLGKSYKPWTIVKLGYNTESRMCWRKYCIPGGRMNTLYFTRYRIGLHVSTCLFKHNS